MDKPQDSLNIVTTLMFSVGLLIILGIGLHAWANDGAAQSNIGSAIVGRHTVEASASLAL